MKKRKILIMGILNFTPDSFSDGGLFNEKSLAIKKVREMLKDGADIIDIGGESTGPGSRKVSTAEEEKRTIPLIKEIKKITKKPISIDTYKSKIAERALQAGASIINDVSALRGDKNMAKVAAKYNCPIILMYSKDVTPHATVKEKKYTDIIKTVKKFLTTRIKLAKKNGIKEENIIIDPGMGQFVSSIPEYSFEIITRLDELKSLNKKILVGISRKSFLGGHIRDRDEKSNLLSVISALNGATIIRTHDVKGLKKALKTVK